MTRPNAAIAAGYSQKIAYRKAPPPVVVDLAALFEQRGMTNRMKVDKCIEGMNATKIISIKSDETTEGGAKIYVEREVPDWAVRHKYLETMLRLCKQLETSKQGDTNILMIGSLADRIRESRERTTAGFRILSAEVEGDDVSIRIEDGQEAELKAEQKKYEKCVDVTESSDIF